jgi:hypothetical protein
MNQTRLFPYPNLTKLPDAFIEKTAILQAVDCIDNDCRILANIIILLCRQKRFLYWILPCKAFPF